MLKRIIAFIIAACAVLPFGVYAGGDMNILKGLEYTVTSGVPIEGSYANHPENETDTFFKLTDGKTADSVSSGAWCKWLRGVSRIIDFDLGKAYALTSFEAAFMHIKTSGMYIPRYIRIYASSDGVSYHLWASPEMPLSMSSDAKKRAVFTYSDDRQMTAQYIKIVICTDINVWCDELILNGYACDDTNPVSGEEYSVPDGDYFPKYASSIQGAGDIIKIYNGYYGSDTQTGTNTANELLPYIGYVSADGTVTDTMFDAVTFVPIHSDYPSGGRLTLTNNKPGAVMSDWLLYLDDTFAQDVNCDALDHTAQTVSDTLGKDVNIKVFFTLPYPTVISGAFGDIDGDGVQEYCRTFEERFAILKWYADLIRERFDAEGYTNLTFCGYYWYREEVNESNSDDERTLVESISQYVHSYGCSLLFDPFYLSCGFTEYASLGFDCAFMQPNLCFYDYFTDEVLAKFATAARMYSTGCEIECIEPYKLTGDVDKHGIIFEKYLYYAWKYGYIDAAHSYYQGAGPGSFYTMCYSSQPYVRKLYDKLYEFIKGTYSYDELSVSCDALVCDSTKVRGSLKIESGTSRSVSVTVQPLHGTVSFTGTVFVYKPEEGYSGEDSFTVNVSDTIAPPVTLTVSVSVIDRTASAAMSENESKANKGSDKPALYASAAAITAAAAAALIFILKKRKGNKK
ncbi:MAG TPA: DUF4855 domain-containing protein [Bacillota bacterium]|nr:DUF4855 domain-containing protein [Bacillota bacterium]